MSPSREESDDDDDDDTIEAVDGGDMASDQVCILMKHNDSYLFKLRKLNLIYLFFEVRAVFMSTNYK